MAEQLMHGIEIQPQTPDNTANAVSPHPNPSAEPPQSLTVAGQHLTVFVEAPPLFDAMLADIRAAKKRVWLETYIFFNDDGGSRIAAALAEKAKQGLDVRLLFDAIGSALTPNNFFTQLAAAGVTVHVFHSLLEGLRRFRPLSFFNRRNHRKLLIIDDAVGYFGGMNIVDNVETVHQQKAEQKPTSSGWRDVHIRLQGPQQSELAESFNRSWRRARGEKVPRRSRAYRRALHLNGISHNLSPEAPETIHFFDSGPGRKYSRAARAFSRLIRHAHSEITLSMAYFLPTGQVLRALLGARRRGIKIRIVVPGKSDVHLVQRATAYLYDKLIRRGFRIYERRHQMLHSKTMVVDGLYAIVGSSNLDPRSLYINLEFLAIIRSRKFAAILQSICRYEMTHSDRITVHHCHRISRTQRFLNMLAWTLRWWL